MLKLRNMDIDKFKQDRFTRQWREQSTAPFIGEVYKKVKAVNIEVEITFKSGVLRNPSINKWRRDLGPSDRLYLHYECTNRDCTGNGFYLTRALQKALESRSCIEGEMWCDGKEDWKYIKSSGCSCMTCLKYKIEPQFEDAQ